MKFNCKSRKGFTLIELLVVIGILAVLAAIAIPSVAGLIDRANVSADNTNANEYTNAIERFTSEYELYCQDVASGKIKDADNDGKPDNMDAAQGRVFNVTKVVTRADITALESTGLGDAMISRDTKYPLNGITLKSIIENYTKTSSVTFEPKQSDKVYWYSPDCGLVVVANPNSSKDALNNLVISGKDAKGNTLGSGTNWVDVTNYSLIKIICGNGADGLHYHNDELFTGICDSDGEWYDNGVQGPICFLSGTKITMANGTQKNIEDIIVGDKVVSYNVETKIFYITTVCNTFVRETEVYYTIRFDDGTELNLTGCHPLLTPKGFENITGVHERLNMVDALDVGDEVISVNDTKKIVSIEKIIEKTTVYNFNVIDDEEIIIGKDNDSNDTYIANGIVSHNADYS